MDKQSTDEKGSALEVERCPSNSSPSMETEKRDKTGEAVTEPGTTMQSFAHLDEKKILRKVCRPRCLHSEITLLANLGVHN